MSDNYLDFAITDVFGDVADTTYTLPNTPLTFTPDFNTYNPQVLSNQYIVWDFGDDTYSTDITATHQYKTPGKYTISVRLVKNDGTGETSSVQKQITAYDFVSDFITVSSTGFTALSAGVYSPPINIFRYNSWQTYNDVDGVYTIIPFASGGRSNRYDVYTYSRQPYSHLIPTNRFVVREYIAAISAYDDIIVDRLTTTTTEIYVDLDVTNKSYTVLTEPTSTSVFAGTSGTATVYFVDDYPTLYNTGYNLFFTWDTTNINKSAVYNNELPILNVNSQVLYFNSVDEIVPNKLSITSNGIVGEGQELDTFDINSAQFKEGVVSFVVRPRTNTDYSVSYISLSGATTIFDPLYYTANPNKVYVVLVNKNNEVIPGYSTPSNNIVVDEVVYKDTITPYIKGKIYLSDVPAVSSEDLRIYAVGYIGYPETLVPIPPVIIDGYSTTFDVYTASNYGGIAKVNENFDSYKAYTSLATQPIIAASNVLLEDVLGDIGGSVSASVDAPGKRIYEKIANFVNNVSDVDTCNVESIFSYCELYGVDVVKYTRENLLTRYPSDLGRLLDLFSIKRNHLFGTRNNWIENLDKRTMVFNEKYGINTNTQTTTYTSQVSSLDIETAILNKDDRFIVAYEQFTRLYSLMPLDIASVSATTFPLSSLDQSWGWNLVLPAEFYSLPVNDRIVVLKQFYTFYEWNNYVDGTVVGNTINWGDEYNTQIKLPYYQEYPQWNSPNLLSSWNDSSLSAWFADNGIVDRNLIYQLSVGVGILSSV